MFPFSLQTSLTHKSLTKSLFFLWLSIHNKFFLGEQLTRRGWNGPFHFSLCGEAEEIGVRWQLGLEDEDEQETRDLEYWVKRLDEIMPP